MRGKKLDWDKAKWDKLKGQSELGDKEIGQAEEAQLGDWLASRPDNLQPTSPATPIKEKKRSRPPKHVREKRRAEFEARRRAANLERQTEKVLDKSTYALLQGSVPHTLSLDVANLKSKTHTKGCNANKALGTC